MAGRRPMHPELAKQIESAAEIMASGRWAAVNERIKQCALPVEAENNWHFVLFSSLCFQVFSEYLLLKSAYEGQKRRHEPLLAWRARNLLELSVWAIYCCRSEQNARRLYEDAGRDPRDLFGAFEKWGAAPYAAATSIPCRRAAGRWHWW